MKFLWLILTVYVVFLSVKPCCEDKYCYGKYSVEKSQQKDRDKDCQGCSPFFTCGTCSGFIVTKAVNSNVTLISEPSLKHFANYRDPFIKQIALAIWQPPKLG